MVLEGGAIGIDFGTTSCCLAYWDQDHVEIIANAEENYKIPSNILFEDDRILFGDIAKNYGGFNPSHSISLLRLILGKKFEELPKKLPFTVVEGPDGFPLVEVTFRGESKKFSAVVLCAMLFSHLKSVAEAAKGQEVSHAVISIPTCYSQNQIQAMKDAAAIAKINILRFINEASLAAMGYGIAPEVDVNDRKVVVVDYGGGSLSISLLIFDNGIFEVKATSGALNLGGEELDLRMVQHCTNDFRKRYGEDIRNNSKALYRLKSACERAKRVLSYANEARIEVTSLVKDIDYATVVTRTRFEDLVMDLLCKTTESIEKILLDYRILRRAVDEVVLVGGCSRIPKFREIICEFFVGKAPIISINPDDAIARGAAIQAAILSDRLEDYLLIDVAGVCIGLETAGEVMTPLIRRNTALPTLSSLTFSTAEDNQPGFTIKIIEGEASLAKDNNLLGSMKIEGITPKPKGVSSIDISFSLDSNHNFEVLAKETSSNIEKQQKFSLAQNKLSAEEIKQATDEVEGYLKIERETEIEAN